MFCQKQKTLRVKKSSPLERHSKGQFSEIRYISKGICRILYLCSQMICVHKSSACQEKKTNFRGVQNKPSPVGEGGSRRLTDEVS